MYSHQKVADSTIDNLTTRIASKFYDILRKVPNGYNCFSKKLITESNIVKHRLRGDSGASVEATKDNRVNQQNPANQPEQPLIEQQPEEQLNIQDFPEVIAGVIAEILASENIENPTEEQVHAIWYALVGDSDFYRL